MSLRITTWNVNGIRNPFSYQPWREKRTFEAMFDILEADIVVMQETKIQKKDLSDDMVLVPGWDVFFSLPRHKKGVAIYTRSAKCAPIRAEEGITGVLAAPRTSTSFRDLPPERQIGGYPRPAQLSDTIDEITLDSEGRCVILEFPAFVLLGVYSPANRDESRDDFRLAFLEALDIRIRNLVALGKRVVLLGDLNVVRSGLDSSNVSEALRKSEMTMDEWASVPSRRLFNHLIFDGWVLGERDEGRDQPALWDLCRCFHPTRKGMNTCWDTKKNTRPANYGSRIDYILCSDQIKPWFTDANIQEGLMGSDHCPVYVTMADMVTIDGENVHLLDIMNPPGVMQNGERIRVLEQRDFLGLSARLIPEFDRRQSIRDMFMKKNIDKKLASQHQTVQEETQNHVASQTSISSDINSRDGQSRACSFARDELESNAVTGNMASDISRSPTMLKRTAESTPSLAKSKRAKPSSTTSQNGSAKIPRGQETLKRFFKPKEPPSTTHPLNPLEENMSTSDTSISQEPLDWQQDARQLDVPESPRDSAARSSEQAGSKYQEQIFDPIQAKESWSKLLGKRSVPKCEHEEPCISLVTKKPGVNCGRSFYICPRPLGPSGQKEKHSEWRCGTFIWSSDWNG